MSLGFTGEINQIKKKKVTLPEAEEAQQNHNNNSKNYIWFGSAISSAIILSSFFLIYTTTQYNPKVTYIAPSLLGVSTMIAIFTWIQTMLSMNKLKYKKISTPRWIALATSITASLCYFSSSLAVMERNWTLQFLCSLAGSIIGWFSFITIYAGKFITPTKQQLWALLQIILLAFLWELRTFIVNMHFD